MKNLLVLTALSISVLSSGFANAEYSVKIPLEFDWIKFVDKGDSGNGGDDGSGGTGGENGSGNEGGETDPTNPEDPEEELTEEEKEKKCSDSVEIFKQMYGSMYQQYNSGIEDGECKFNFTGGNNSLYNIHLYQVVDSVIYGNTLGINITILWSREYLNSLGVIAAADRGYTPEYNRLIDNVGGVVITPSATATKTIYNEYKFFVSGTTNCRNDIKEFIDNNSLGDYWGGTGLGRCAGWVDIFRLSVSTSR